MTSSNNEQKNEPGDQERQILPAHILPKHYSLSYPSINFAVDSNEDKNAKSQAKFNGVVTIDLDIKSVTNKIMLNSIDIEYNSVSVTQNKAEQAIDTKTLVYDKNKEQMTIPLLNELTVGEAQVAIEFTGILNDKMKGFYRSSYKRSNGNPAYCGITQFEPTDARLAFPCFDEPAKKATFDVELTVPKDLVCLSNMPIVKETIDQNNKRVQFARTPIMSVYLLAWCIGEFECIEAKTKRGIIVRLWTTVGNKHKVTFACKTACRCLDFYEQYFEINYPLPKCDMIAVPDFAAGAMENWGLVTYREARLMCDEDTAALRVKQRICLVICHELAHQWFGNLVTMDWWSQLWLNEGFARFMEYFCTEKLFPDWNIWDLFLSAAFNRAFSLDAMTTSHAIEIDIKTVQEVDSVFDAISYAKGAAVIKMVVSFLGEKVFQTGIQKYLTHFAYKNAVTSDLWQFLKLASGKPVADIMGNWVSQQGFPLIEVSRNGNQLTFNQSRFLSTGKPTDEQNKTIWNVPINMKFEGTDELVQFVLTKRSDTFEIDAKYLNCKWIHINANNTGFYCCKYDEQMFKALSNALVSNHPQLTPIDKVCLIRDTRALAISCNFQTATIQLLDLMASLKNEQTYLVWQELLTGAANIRHILNGDDDGDDAIIQSFNAVMRSLVMPIYNKLQWGSKSSNANDESEEVRDLFRPLALGAMMKYEHTEVIEETKKRFHLFMNLKLNENVNANANADGNIVSSLRRTIFIISLRHGTQKEHALLKQYYLQSNDSMEKRWALSGLGHARDPKLIEDNLNWVLNSDEVRLQDKLFLLFAISRAGSKGRISAWDYLRNQWPQWHQKFGGGGFQLMSLVKLPQGFVTQQRADQVAAFYKTLDEETFAKCKRNISQCIEQIRKNAQWRDKELKNIQQWCSSFLNQNK